MRAHSSSPAIGQFGPLVKTLLKREVKRQDTLHLDWHPGQLSRLEDPLFCSRKCGFAEQRMAADNVRTDYVAILRDNDLHLHLSRGVSCLRDWRIRWLNSFNGIPRDHTTRHLDYLGNRCRFRCWFRSRRWWRRWWFATTPTRNSTGYASRLAARDSTRNSLRDCGRDH